MNGAELRAWLMEFWLPISPRGGLAATLTFTVLIFLARAAGLFGIFLAWVLMFGFARHLVDVLDARANGSKWPVPEAEAFNPFHETRRFAIAVFACATVVAVLVLVQHGGASVAAGVALLALIPAMLALSAVDFDPWRWFDIPAQLRFIARTGWHYAALLVAWLLLLLMLGNAGRAPGLVVYLLDTYTFVFVFSSVGGLVYRSRNSIGHIAPRAPEVREAKAERRILQRWQRSLSLAYQYFSRGNEVGGRGVLANLIDAEANEPDFLPWLFAELSDWEEPRPMLLLAPKLIDEYLEAGDKAAALEVASRCLSADPAYSRSFRNRAAIAAAALELGRADLAAEFS